MTPREAGTIELEEPNWKEVFEQECGRWANSPRWFAEENAFESTMRRYRRFHFTWVEVDGQAKRNPAGATEAIIALAKLRIFPPRWTIKDTPRDGVSGYQCDDHMWVGPWRVVAIEERMLLMERYLEIEGQPETRQIDLSKADWTKYTETAIEVLATMSAAPLI